MLKVGPNADALQNTRDCVFFVFVKISLTFEPIGLSILGKLPIGFRIVSDYIDFEVFFCPFHI